MNEDQEAVNPSHRKKEPIFGFLMICASAAMFFNVGGISDLIDINNEALPYCCLVTLFLGIIAVFFGLGDS